MGKKGVEVYFGFLSTKSNSFPFFLLKICKVVMKYPGVNQDRCRKSWSFRISGFVYRSVTMKNLGSLGIYYTNLSKLYPR